MTDISTFQSTSDTHKNVLILGISGMLGNAVFRILSKNDELNVFGTIRNEKSKTFFNNQLKEKIISNINVLHENAIEKVFEIANPNIVINCIGLIKQLSDSNDILKAIPINTLLPHLLVEQCFKSNSRLIHFSTDCVFSGKKGNYVENDFPDCYDIYGRSKLLGEINNSKFVVTLRTSIIGHELSESKSLVNWFLSQKKSVNGFKNAIYSGLPTVELANIINKYLIPNPKLHGLYHVASNPINKYDLLKIISRIYNKNISIIPFEEFVVDRSLVSNKFNSQTGYVSPDWSTLIEMMFEDFKDANFKILG